MDSRCGLNSGIREDPSSISKRIPRWYWLGGVVWCGSGGGSVAGWVAGGVMEAGMAMDNGAGRSALNCCIISANCLSASILFLSIDSCIYHKDSGFLLDLQGSPI
ncbi:hypothetical protein Tco_0899093 [Tanacetum coccineum]